MWKVSTGLFTLLGTLTFRVVRDWKTCLWVVTQVI